jgi:signal transduction histidine kinase/CheY-like chemotaxis protein
VAGMAALALGGTILGRGPFAWGTLTERLVLLQLFLAVAAVAAFVLASVPAEKQQAERERTELLARERAARLELERANESKDEFLAVLSHELRTPLTPIIGWTRMLRDLALDQPTREHALEVIERNANVQIRLVEDLLDVSRIVTGKMTLDRQPLDLRDVTDAALSTVSGAAGDRSVVLECRLGDEPAIVVGDANRLQQALANVIQNAVKFTPAGGHVRIGIDVQTTAVSVTVRDTGLGISADFLPRIFGPFVQADTGTTRSHGGLGLGLAIVRHLIEAHGGTVSAGSDGANRGTTIEVCLPRSTAPLPRRPAPVVAAPPEPLLRTRVLLVEDDVDTLDFLAEILRRAGAILQVAQTADAALAAIEAQPPDVLVADLGLPGKSGIELIQLVRARPSSRGGSVPAVVLTAYASPEDQRRAERAGFDAYLTKPVRRELLVATLEKLARSRAGMLDSQG